MLQATIKKAISSMPRCREAVIANKGDYTKYECIFVNE